MMEVWPDLEDSQEIIKLNHSNVELFYYDTRGDELPVCVLVHGLADEADTWRHVVLPLSKTHRVLVPDLPGFGRSSKPKVPYTVPWLSSVLIEFLDSQSVHDALICGSSLGGVLSQNISLERPDLVSRLVLVDGVINMDSPRISFPLLLFLTPFLGELLYNSLRKNIDKAYQTLEPYYFNLKGMSEADRAFLCKRVHDRVWDEGQKYAFFSVLRNLGPWLRQRQKTLHREMTEFTIPTLIIWGENDPIMPRKIGMRLHDILTKSEFEIIKDAGHLPHQEQPVKFLDILKSFIKSSGRHSPS
jgi:pimeloyl-ACP methyl ester carboxylesterase